MILRLASYIYGFAIWCRNKLFDHGLLSSRSLPGVVISVGNIAVGGTGKSPVVISIARDLQRQGFRPAIVTRGYRSGLGRSQWQALSGGQVVFGVRDQRVVADEARMQSLALPDVPVIVGADRFAAVQNFLLASDAVKPTHYILDDGFQHRSIKRDVDLVVIDARDPFGRLLPWGRFRESWGALRRATGVVVTKANDHDQVERLRQNVFRAHQNLPVWECRFEFGKPELKVGELSGLGVSTRWCAIAGIANPADFLVALRPFHIHPEVQLISGDHRSFDLKAVNGLMGKFDAIITTEKDWARDEPGFKSLNYPIFVLPIRVSWAGGQPQFGAKSL